MILKRRHSLWIALLLAGTGLSLDAAEFAPPAEGPVAFRRDRIPLDPDAMAGLSKSLETLARALNAETPADHRGAAQMLALALALDPANAKARELVTVYQEDRHKPDGDLEKLEKSRARIWQYIAWLETPEAGSQGQALAACLKDVIVISDPKNPKAGALREAGEKGAWAGWVPAISAYEPKAIATNEDPVKPSPETVPGAKNGIPLESAQVHTMLWQMVGKGDTASWILAAAPLQMTAVKIEESEDGGDEKHRKPQPFSISVGPDEAGAALGPMGASLRALLTKQHENLPQGIHVSITSKELQKSLESKKRQSISAAAAVLASSAVTGREPEAIIIGQIDGTGAFKLPTGFWDQLQSLGKGGGQRLVLPADAVTYLPSMLALEKPGFFMEYEVLLAADFKQLLDLTAKTPEGTVATAIAEFRKIRERAGTQEIRQYIANTFVKQRLAAVLQDAPTHYSAKMLLIQAAGNRPILVARQVLAAEIRRALEPMLWLVGLQVDNSDNPESSRIGQTYEICRTRVDALERYADKNDRVLVDHARDLVIAIRNLDRANRTRGESYDVLPAVRAARAELNRLANQYNAELAAAAGDARLGPSAD
jgi:hypothetical protein